MNSVRARTSYQGALQIVQFNWRFYVAAIFVAAAAGIASPFLPHPARWMVAVCIWPALFWMASSLIVSHYIYDRSALYELNWIDTFLPHAPLKWINIHSGLDETTELLAAQFPRSHSESVDIYDPHVMTEPSIAIARHHQSSPIHPTAARYDALPFAAGSIDAAFVIFAAHELRHHPQRVAFFTEIARILTPNGNILLVEHTRDLWNLLAFGPGVFHFFSAHAWRRAISDAALVIDAESSATPFVHLYNLRKAA